MLGCFEKRLLKFFSPDMRDVYHGLKRYNLKKCQKNSEQFLIKLVDGKCYHGGFCDRLKGIISLFHYCLVKRISFKILYTYPFNLEDFLLPNEYDWTMKEEYLCSNLFKARFVNLVGDASAGRLITLNTQKQIHCYANRDIVDDLNLIYGTNYDWGALFKKLFKPTDKLTNLIEYHSNVIGGNYICAVFRFQQLLGDFEEYNFPILSEYEKEKLISKNIDAINFLVSEFPGKKILLTSDSQTFLERASCIESVYPLMGKVVHIDCSRNEEHDVYLKSFLDFFMLSRGDKIYSIGTKEMYKTEFPLYSAKINNIPFERIVIQ